MQREPSLDRRSVLAGAAALGANLVLAERVHASRRPWRERRDLYPDGVASGDPDAHSVMLWTRREFEGATQGDLHVEVALDPDFRKVVSASQVTAYRDSDWTCRVLAVGLKPATVYWYRFSDEAGMGSRVGRTITAPADDDDRPVRFAFVSCQSVNEGAQNAYRRMLWEDRQAPADRRLGFVLHLGDFIYEVVEYPEEVAKRFDRTVYEVCRIPDSRKVSNFHVPTTLEGYRAVYRGHIRDPDVQDARAWLPFVCIGDNHEFSWQGWQSFIKLGGPAEPAQKLRVAANQAWWEYIPSRVQKSSGPGLDRFDGPEVENAPITRFDEDGLGDEPNNRAALASMTAYRACRYGRNVELLITDLHSYRMEDPASRKEGDPLGMAEFPFTPQELMEALDAGRAYNGGDPPDQLTFGESKVDNFRKTEPPATRLGRVQKQWLKRRLAASKATWKVWAATNPPLQMRADPQNLPEGLTAPWPGKDYAILNSGDLSCAYTERGEIYDHVRDAGIEGFVTVSGDRHSFWAGYATKALPPAGFAPVGVSFATGSISAPGMLEGVEHSFRKDHPLRPLYLADRPGQAKPEGTVNLLLNHGVRTALEYARSGDIERARALANPDSAPHVAFVDMGGHGYSVVTASADAIDTEFVCIPRPIARSATDDGGPLRYRVSHRAQRWRAGEAPRLEQTVLEGDAKLSI